MTHQELLNGKDKFQTHEEWVEAVNAAKIPVALEDNGEIRLLKEDDPEYSNPSWFYYIRPGHKPKP